MAKRDLEINEEISINDLLTQIEELLKQVKLRLEKRQHIQINSK